MLVQLLSDRLREIVVNCKGIISYSEDEAKGNVHMESLNGRFKVENRLISWELNDYTKLKKVVDKRIRYYNYVRKHSALGN